MTVYLCRIPRYNSEGCPPTRALSLRQTEDAFGDDVALDLSRTSGDGGGARA